MSATVVKQGNNPQNIEVRERKKKPKPSSSQK